MVALKKIKVQKLLIQIEQLHPKLVNNQKKIIVKKENL
jgi:hypothetical protein